MKEDGCEWILDHVPPGKELFPFQIEGIYDICRRFSGSCYLGDDMGLGKTIQAVIAANILKTKKILVVCPATVRPVWKNEFQEWSTHPYLVQVLTSGKDKIRDDAEIVVVSYDLTIKKSIGTQLLERSWDLVIFDECHALQKHSAKRTQFALRKLYPKARKTLFLSGSIAADKIIDVQPVFGALCPRLFGEFWKFARRYTYAELGDYGWSFKGGRNLKELGRLARKNFLIRRKKESVLKQLPERLFQKVMVQLPEEVQRRQETAAQIFAKEIKAKIDKGSNVVDSELAAARRELGVEKIPLIIDYIEELFTEGAKGLVVFCYHREVFTKLKSELSKKRKVVGILGASSAKTREESVEKFQQGKAEIFLATSAGAEGITLTRANIVIFAEQSFTLSHTEQAIDRLHRIGQKNTVYVKFLVCENSIDERVYRSYKSKLNVKTKAFS